MKEVIEIDLNDKNDLLEKYNEKKLSSDMFEYIIKQAAQIKRDKKIKLVINKRCHIEKDITKLIKEGLKEEYNKSIQERHDNNIEQVIFLLVGFIIIFLSTLLEDESIWNEILLIAGWVPIWETVEVELFPDVAGRKKRKIIKRLLESEIVVNSLETEEVH